MNPKQLNSLSRCIRKPVVLLSVGLALTMGGIARADSAAHSNIVTRAQATLMLSSLALLPNCGPDGVRICTPHGCYCA